MSILKSSIKKHNVSCSRKGRDHKISHGRLNEDMTPARYSFKDYISSNNWMRRDMGFAIHDQLISIMYDSSIENMKLQNTNALRVIKKRLNSIMYNNRANLYERWEYGSLDDYNHQVELITRRIDKYLQYVHDNPKT